jgi:hypothetical protein
MSEPVVLTEQDWTVRAFVYRNWIDTAHPPSAEECARILRISHDDARASYSRLNQRHLIVLDDPGGWIRMAHPLSGIDTGYRVHSDGKTYDANCAWDSVGVSALIGRDVEIEGVNGLTQEKVTYSIRNGRLVADPLLVHFLVPLRAWYDDLVYT